MTASVNNNNEKSSSKSNKSSSLLSSEENDLVHTLLGKKCQVRLICYNTEMGRLIYQSIKDCKDMNSCNTLTRNVY